MTEHTNKHKKDYFFFDLQKSLSTLPLKMLLIIIHIHCRRQIQQREELLPRDNDYQFWSLLKRLFPCDQLGVEKQSY